MVQGGDIAGDDVLARQFRQLVEMGPGPAAVLPVHGGLVHGPAVAGGRQQEVAAQAGEQAGAEEIHRDPAGGV